MKNQSQKICRNFLLEKQLPLTIRRIGQRYFLVSVPFSQLPPPRVIISWTVLYNLIKEM
jgi:hypothetical protein